MKVGFSNVCKRTLSLLLVLLMIVDMLPASVLAAEVTDATTAVVGDTFVVSGSNAAPADSSVAGTHWENPVKSADTICGKIEHAHTDDCYDKNLNCTHTSHDANCYTDEVKVTGFSAIACAANRCGKHTYHFYVGTTIYGANTMSCTHTHIPYGQANSCYTKGNPGRNCPTVSLRNWTPYEHTHTEPDCYSYTWTLAWDVLDVNVTISGNDNVKASEVPAKVTYGTDLTFKLSATSDAYNAWSATINGTQVVALSADSTTTVTVKNVTDGNITVELSSAPLTTYAITVVEEGKIDGCSYTITGATENLLPGATVNVDTTMPANSSNAFYKAEVSVSGNGATYDNGVVTVGDGDVTITITYTAKVLGQQQTIGEVEYNTLMELSQVKQNIFAALVDSGASIPAGVQWNDLEYVYFPWVEVKIAGFTSSSEYIDEAFALDQTKADDTNGARTHDYFAFSERDTQKVRVTLPGDPALYIEAEIKLVDKRQAAQIILDKLSYSTDTFEQFKTAVKNNVVVTDNKGQAVPFEVTFAPNDQFPGTYTVTVTVAADGASYLATSAEFTVVAEANTYEVKWDIDGDGNVDTTTEVAYGTIPTPPAAALKDGWSFAGWTPALVAVDGTPVTYMATYSMDTVYTVTYTVDGEVYATQNVNVTKGEKVNAVADPDKDFAVFAGWTNADVIGKVPSADMELVAQWHTDTNNNNVNDADETVTVVVGEGGSLTIDGADVTSGSFVFDSTVATHTIVATPADVDGADGSANYVASLTAGGVAVGTYADFVLSGDAVLANGVTVEVTFGTVKAVAKDNTVYINGWQSSLIDYSGRVAGYMAELTTANFLDASSVVADGAYTVQIKSLTNWIAVNDLSGLSSAYATMEDTDLRILWTPADSAKYPALISNTVRADIEEARQAPTITLNKTEYNVDTLDQLIEQIKQNTATVDGAALNVTVEGFPGAGKASITVTNNGATWVKSTEASIFDVNVTINEYTVTWDAANGTAPVIQQVAYGTVPAAPAAPVKAADAQYTYIFAGWTPTISEVTGAVTYTAQYDATIRSYDVIWQNFDGTVLGTDTVEYGTIPVYTHATPIKTDASWDGWDKNIVAVTGPVTYTAVFTDDTVYTVTFKNGNEVVFTDYVNVTDGEVTAPYAVADEANKIFNAWYLNGTAFAFGGTLTDNIVLVANWIEDINDNNVLDTQETAQISTNVIGGGVITVSGAISTDDGYVYDSIQTDHVIVTVTVADTDGADGKAGYIQSVSNNLIATGETGVYSLAVSGSNTYEVSAVIAEHKLVLEDNPTACVNLHSSKLSEMASGAAVKAMVLAAVLGDTEYDSADYIVEKDVGGNFIDVEVTLQSNALGYATLMAALANDIRDGSFSDTFRVTLKAHDNMPVVSNTIFVKVLDSRSAAEAIHNGNSYTSSVLNNTLLNIIKADITAPAGVSYTVAWAENIPTSLTEGETYAIDVVVTTIESVDYLGNTQTITVTVYAPIVTGGIVIEPESEMNYNTGMTDANKMEMVIAAVNPQFTPDELANAHTTVWYKASTARMVPMTINLAAMDLGVFGSLLPDTTTIQIPVSDLWWNIGIDFPVVEAPSTALIEKILLEDLIPNYGTDYALGRLNNEQLKQILADTMLKYPEINAYYQYLGAHAFGENDVLDADGNVLETVKLTQADNGYGSLESNEGVITLKDLRAASFIKLNEGVAVTYKAYTPQNLLAALVEGVYDEQGNRIGGAELVAFVDDVSCLPASEGTEITVKFSGNITYKASTATATVVIKKAAVDVQVDNRLIKWQPGLRYPLPVVTNPAGVDTIQFIVGLDVSDVNVQDKRIKGIVGEVQLLLPEQLQKLLSTLDSTINSTLGTNISFADGSSMKLSDLKKSMNAIGQLLKDTQYAAYTDVLLNMLGSLPTDTADVMVTVGGDLPTDIGVYLVGAVSADNNYTTDFGVGAVVITPDGIKAELDWAQTDDNNIITRTLLTSGVYDMSAVAVSVGESGNLEAATAQVVELFLGLDIEGNIILETDQTKLNVGAYVEIAMIVNWGNQMYYSAPIARAFVVITESLNVEFVDENGQVNPERLYEFDNEVQAGMENLLVTYKYDSKNGQHVAGDVVADYDVKYLYAGMQTNGQPYAGTTAPVHAGAYTLTALVTVKDATGEYSYAGVAIGALAIEPTISEVAVDSQAIRFDGSGHKPAELVNATSKVPGLKPDTTIISAGLSVDLDNITGLESINGNVNVDLPQWLDDVMRRYGLLQAGYGSGISASTFVAYIDEIEQALVGVGVENDTFLSVADVIKQLPGNTTLTFHEAAYSEVGVYLVAAVVTDSDHYPSVDAGIMVIYPDATEVELKFEEDWNGNNIFTWTALSNMNLNAKPYDVEGNLVADAVNSVKNLYVGVDDNGKIVVLGVAGNNDAKNVLDNGLYTQVAFVLDMGNSLYYAEPITRAFMIVPNPAQIIFVDESGNENNDRHFVFNNQSHKMAVKITMNGQVIADHTGLHIYYTGVQTNGQTYASTEAPIHAGIYTVTATYEVRDELDRLVTIGAAVGAMVIEPAESEIVVENGLHIYDGNAFDIEKLVHAGSVNSNVTPDATIITAAVSTDGTFSEVGVKAIVGSVNVAFPRWLDTILAENFPSAYASGITAQQFISKLNAYADTMEEKGIPADLLDRVINFIGSLPSNTTLTFQNQEMANPVKVGAYLITAIVTDSDHYPSADLGLLLIAPQMVEAELRYTDGDKNEIYTVDSLKVYDLTADAFVDGVYSQEATAHVDNVFVGINQYGKLVASGDYTSLKPGAYIELSYLTDLDSIWYVAAPISRDILVVANMYDLQILDENGNDNPYRQFTFDGNAKTIDRVKILDQYGNVVSVGTEDILKIVYTGVDTLGNAYACAEAPVNAGAYAVTVVFMDYDESGNLIGTGSTSGAMFIKKADLDFDLLDTKTIYDGNEQFVNVVNPENTDALMLIVDRQANVANLILDDDLLAIRSMLEKIIGRSLTDHISFDELLSAVHTVIDAIKDYEVPEALKAVASLLPEALQTELAQLIQTEVKPVLVELATILQKIQDATPLSGSLAINGQKPVNAGQYEFYAITYAANYVPEVSEGVLTINPAAVTVAVDDAQKSYGEADPAFTYTVEGVMGSEELVVAVNREAGENVGIYAVNATYEQNANYIVTVVPGTLTIVKAEPQFTTPAGLQATYGETLADVELPDGFTWKDATESVGNAGTNSFTVVYTPDDTNNYNTVEIEVSVAVAKADSEMAKAPEAISPLMFNGADQTLVKDGIAIGGILVYGLSESGSFSTTLPTGKEIGEYTVYYKVQGDANHNDTAVQSVKVTIYPDKITSDVHTVEQSTHIRKIEAGLTVSRLWENINEKAYVTVFNADGTVAQSDALAATGMKAKMFIEGVEVDSVTVIVTGDVNGDGKVSITDMAATNNHILEKTMLTGVYLIAGDTNKDGKVSITDYAQITYHVLEKNQVEAN